MKKALLLFFAMGIFLFATVTNGAPRIDNKETQEPEIKWKKSKSGAWKGKWEGSTYWYKVSDDKIVRSSDGKSWKAMDNKRWTDIDGKWIQIDAGNLLWSNDSGRTWAPVPDRRWRAADGKWYKFDQRWELWIEK